MPIKESFKRCSTCSRATKLNGSNKTRPDYLCENGNIVARNGTCDRWIHEVSDREFHQKCRESIKRMEPFQEGTYQIRKLPPLGTNYRILENGD